jgi:hypothetical protein
MCLSRKSFLLPIALVVGLFGTPTLTAVHVPGVPGGVAHPPVVQLAAGGRRTRRRRQIRGAKVRAVLRRAVSRLRGAAKRIRAVDERVQTRRAPHDSFARGPPRSLGDRAT